MSVKLMKLQSSIEFLSTYGFLFVVMAVALAIIIFLASSAQSNFTAQCAGYGGFVCSYSSYYSNLSSYYSLATVALESSQSVPLNITSFNATVGTTTVNGLCTPNFVYPGETVVCSVPFNGIMTLGTFVKGYYAVGAKYCNNAIGEIPLNNCTQAVTYTGSFLTESTAVGGVVFGVAVGQGANAISPITYNSISPPFLPGNYVLAQNGEWDVNGTGGNVIYSFSTNSYIGSGYLGTNAVAFPQSTAMLNNVTTCATSFTPLISMAFTTLYANANVNLEKIETTNAMALYYRPNGASTWNSFFGSNSWTSNGITGYTANTVLNPGLYNLESVWYTPCGQGLQALNIT